MKYISLFAGIGGFDLALDRLGHECVWANEWDKYATQIYRNRFNREIDARDIRLVETSDIPDFDLLVGGFPCQAFSIAGKRKGFEDTRGTLFFEIARIIKDKRPRYFLLENVKGLLNHDSGKTFQTILATINELGYECEWQILNSKNHGVPQNRERIFISGYIRGESRPEVLPIRFSNNKDIIQINNPKHSNNRFYGTDGLAPALRTMQGGNRQPKIAIPTVNPDMVKIPEATKKGYAEATVGQAINLAVPNSKTRRGRVSDIAQTLDTGMQQYTLTEGYRIRRLTEIECERLQGFPDQHSEGVSSTQRYKCLGNAVTVNVIYDICKGYPNEQH